jgi:hypothetical protein
VSDSSRRPVVGVDGLNTLKRTMRQAGVDVADLKQAHARVAAIVVARARATAPWGPDVGGHIKPTIRGSGQAGAAVIRVGRAAQPYPNPLHWGWPARHIKAQPFVWDAIADTQGQWFDEYVTALNDLIDKVEGAPGP